MTQQDQDAATTRRTPERRRGGKWVLFGDEWLQVPPLAFEDVIELQDKVEGLKDMGARPTRDQMKVISEIVHSALARNYPSISVDEVRGMLDLGNYSEVLNAVMSIGGYVKAPAGGAGTGEPPASTGTASTPP